MTRYTIPRIIPSVVVSEAATTSRRAEAPEELFSFWDEVIAAEKDYDPEVETLAVVIFNARLDIKAWSRISTGTLDETCAHPRELLKPVIIRSGFAFAVMHNHPSGDPAPSSADLRVTKEIKEAAELMRIRMLDHVIVASAHARKPTVTPFFSFRESGII